MGDQTEDNMARNGLEELEGTTSNGRPDGVVSDDGAPIGSGVAAGPEDEKAALVRERDELKDKLLRAQAECANIAKRLNQQHATSLRHASSGFARSMLPILDGLERTLQSLEPADRNDPIYEGVMLLRDEFIKALRSNAVEPIESVGRPFDPAFHEALMQDTNSDLSSGTVSQEFERGYKLHDRVLRHAKVAVSAKPREGDGVDDGVETVLKS
ncbi:MAG: nucleotide exchange factor GrpE [Phycisphaerae bacterium]|nr:nucleotide exchange factor GrpE [Phycisphaerae bacterium]